MAEKKIEATVSSERLEGRTIVYTIEATGISRDSRPLRTDPDLSIEGFVFHCENDRPYKLDLVTDTWNSGLKTGDRLTVWLSVPDARG
jgi:hypothetical protein